jgi:hypothetical protein
MAGHVANMVECVNLYADWHYFPSLLSPAA